MLPFSRHAIGCCMISSTHSFFRFLFYRILSPFYFWVFLVSEFLDAKRRAEYRTNSHYFFCHLAWDENFRIRKHSVRILSIFDVWLDCMRATYKEAYKDNHFDMMYLELHFIMFYHFPLRCVALSSGFIVFSAYLIHLVRVFFPYGVLMQSLTK